MAAGPPIVDAHQHFWDPEANYHPWLRDEPPIPFRYGDYRAIRRRYLTDDYFADAQGFDVRGTVYVETEWDPRDPLGEMAWVAALRVGTGFPTVAVGQAWLDRGDCASVLEGLAGHAFVRGIRHKPRANPRPGDPAPGGTTDPAWRAGFARLAPLGLSFDLQTPWWHFAEAARLAADFEGTTIVVNHAGLPSDRSPAALAAWRDACARLAACPNVNVKLSGIGQPGRAWTVEANRPIVETLLGLFGPQRCMVGSNFPVDSLCASYATIIGGLVEILSTLSAGERRAVLHDTANRVYAMGLPS
ncbi:MAG: amidohydrolase family protein [Burkholderiaceae bacterium]|nr:amidohydrolase family protein [Burkholderiales bacterium]MCZ8098385.1 amidohydrolase family protein [Burkholderiales bacterium]MCZ8338621.1 amidohydrolase family protein [Burkholderiaceae bacterium]